MKRRIGTNGGKFTKRNMARMRSASREYIYVISSPSNGEREKPSNLRFYCSFDDLFYHQMRYRRFGSGLHFVLFISAAPSARSLSVSNLESISNVSAARTNDGFVRRPGNTGKMHTQLFWRIFSLLFLKQTN